MTPPNGDAPSAGEVAAHGVGRRVMELEARVLELEHFIVDFIKVDEDHGGGDIPEYKGLARVRVDRIRATQSHKPFRKI